MKAALIQLHIAIFLWGFTGVLGRAILINEASLVWWRLLLTVTCLWLLFYLQGKVKRIGLQQFVLVAGIGTLLSIHWLFFYGSIKQANVSIALTCLATSSAAKRP